MNIEKRTIYHIPALLWGTERERLILAVHGSHSSKIDDCIWVLAEEATARGYGVLSFDLPQHGEREYETEPCMVSSCVSELAEVYRFARETAREVSLFGCSMGVYFSLLAFADVPIARAWFLSPVTDMERIIQNMMVACNISEETLEELQTIQTPYETLYWDYYRYVKEHPIVSWPHPTRILRGEDDSLSELASVADFASRFHCVLTEQPGGEHWFHTAEELDYFRHWLREGM